MVREIKNLIGNNTTISVSIMLSLLPIAFSAGIFYSKLSLVDSDNRSIKEAIITLTQIVNSHEAKIQNLEKIVKKP